MAKPLKFTVKKSPNRLTAAHTSTLIVNLGDDPSLLFIRVRRGKQINKKLSPAVCELNRCPDDKELMIDVIRDQKDKKELLVIFNKKADLEEFFKAVFPFSYAPLHAKRLAEEKKRQAALEEEKKKAMALEELRKKMTSPSGKLIFEGSLEVAVKAGGGPIPIVCADCIARLRTEEALKTEGIFRVAPDQGELGEAMHNYAEQKLVSLHKMSPHLAAGVLKRYLRQLLNPLLPFTLYHQFIETTNLDGEGRLTETSKLVSSLPKENFTLLQTIIVLLSFVTTYSEVNLMTSSNCAVVFGQCLLWDNDPGITSANILKHNNIVEFMINNASSLFPDAEPITINTHSPSISVSTTPIPSKSPSPATTPTHSKPASRRSSGEPHIPSREDGSPIPGPPPRPPSSRRQFVDMEKSSSIDSSTSSTRSESPASQPPEPSHNLTLSMTPTGGSGEFLIPALSPSRRPITPPPPSYPSPSASTHSMPPPLPPDRKSRETTNGSVGSRPSSRPASPSSGGSRTLLSSSGRHATTPGPGPGKVHSLTLGSPSTGIPKSRSFDPLPRPTATSSSSSASSSSSTSPPSSPMKSSIFSLHLGGSKHRPVTPTSPSPTDGPSPTEPRESRGLFRGTGIFSKLGSKK